MGLILLAALGFALYWVFLVGATLHALLYPPRRSTAWCVSRGAPETPAALPRARVFESLSFRDPRNVPHELPCWRITGDDPAGPVVIFSHGWGESKQAVLQRIDALAPVCSEIVAWDMPGHGEAPKGRCRLGTSEWLALGDLIELMQGEDPEDRERAAAQLEAEQEDEADWEDFLNREPRAGARPVVLYGFSLGAGVSLQAAAEMSKRVAAVIAEAPYRHPWTPARNVMELRGFPHRLNLRPALAMVGLVSDNGPAWSGFDRAGLAGGLACPLLVLHGTDDAMCPPGDGREIAGAAARSQIREIEGASHLSMWAEERSRAAATEAVRAFIASLPAHRDPDS